MQSLTTKHFPAPSLVAASASFGCPKARTVPITITPRVMMDAARRIFLVIFQLVYLNIDLYPRWFQVITYHKNVNS